VRLDARPKTFAPVKFVTSPTLSFGRTFLLILQKSAKRLPQIAFNDEGVSAFFRQFAIREREELRVKVASFDAEGGRRMLVEICSSRFFISEFRIFLQWVKIAERKFLWSLKWVHVRNSQEKLELEVEVEEEADSTARETLRRAKKVPNNLSGI